MRVGIYARVSTEAQEARGTIGSQLEALRARVAAEGDELVAEFVDDGYSGARLDRPGLDALRDAAEQGPSTRCGACHQTAWPGPSPTRCWSSTSSAASGSPSTSPTRPLSTTTLRPVCSYRCKASSLSTRRRSSPRGNGGASSTGPRAGEVLSRKVPYGYRRVPRGPGPCPPGRARPRSGRGAADLCRLRGRCQYPRPRRRPGGRGHRLARWQARVAPGHDRAPAAQRGLRRAAVLEPHPYELRPLRRAQPPGAAAARGVGPDPRPGHRHRGDLRVGATGCP